MKFLVTTTPRRLQVPPAALLEAGKAWINARLADKTFDCCYGLVTGGGISIVNAESHEKLQALLMSYPAFFLADWKIDPLCDMNHTLDGAIAMLKRMAG